MGRATDEELFARFRRDGEPAALAQVFDRVAADLLHVAVHLCGRTADAEDVVQATFVAAIERAAAWDEQRGLFPWLVGILVRQAGLSRRARARVPDPGRLQPPGVEDPRAAAEHAEVDDAVAAALLQLGEIYRPVVRLHLRHGLGGKEIAEALGRPPSRVRQQLARGLQQLRTLLPTGLGVFAVVTVGAGRGLAAVRQAVLAKAGEAVPIAIGATAGTTLGVMLMKKVITALLLVVLVGLAWWTTSEPPGGPSHPPDGGVGHVATTEVATDARAADAREVPFNVERTAAPPKLGSLRVRAFFLEQSKATAQAANGPPVRAAHPVDAPIEIWPGNRGSPPHGTPRVVRTDADGEAVFAGLAPGPWQVRSLTSVHGAVAAIVESGGEASALVALIATGVVRGRVVDADGQPAAGAEILLYGRGGEGGFFSSFNRGTRPLPQDLYLRRAAFSDAEGRFAVFFGEDEVEVAATKAGCVPSLPQLTRDLGVAELTLSLGRNGADLGGTVVDARGAAVGDALVWLRAQQSQVHRTADGTLLLRRQPRFARTDDHGRFRIDHVPPGKHLLQATAPAHMSSLRKLEVEPGGRAEVELRLDDAVSVVGRVRSAKGALVGWGLQVRATSNRGSPGFISQCMTDGDGNFLLDYVPTGTFVVLVEYGTTLLAERTFVAPQPGMLQCDFVVTDGGLLRGRVVDARGQGLANWRLDAVDATGNPIGLPTATNVDGHFTILRVRGGDCRVRAIFAEGNWSEPEVEASVGAAQNDVLLQVTDDRAGSVSGRLRDHAGAPLADTEVWLRRPHNRNWRNPLLSAADGSFRFDIVPPGKFEVRATMRGVDTRRVREFSLVRGQRLDLGEVVVMPPAHLRVEFARADGSRWEGALPEVWVRNAAGELEPDRRFESLEVVDGGLEGDIDPGHFHLGLDGFDLIAAQQEVRLEPGERTVARFTIAVGRSVELVFEGDGPQGDASNLHLEVFDADGRRIVQQSFRRSPQGDGDWTFEHTFAFGRYDVAAHTDTGRRFRTTVEVRDSLDDPKRILVPVVQ